MVYSLFPHRMYVCINTSCIMYYMVLYNTQVVSYTVQHLLCIICCTVCGIQHIVYLVCTMLFRVMCHMRCMSCENAVWYATYHMLQVWSCVRCDACTVHSMCCIHDRLYGILYVMCCTYQVTRNLQARVNNIQYTPRRLRYLIRDTFKSNN